jgi:hypothetical protein
MPCRRRRAARSELKEPVGLGERERDALRSPQRAQVRVPEAGLLGRGGLHIFIRLRELSSDTSFLSPLPHSLFPASCNPSNGWPGC